MDFNDGSMYRVVADPARQLAERQLYMHRLGSVRLGVPYVDPTFADHRRRLARMPGLVWYQYVHAAPGPEAQADVLCYTLGRLAQNEMVMLDLEPGSATNPSGLTTANVQDFAARWLAVVEMRLSCLAWLYVPGSFAAAVPRSFTGARVVMAPHYSGTPSWPHDVHQYTESGYFPGCTQTGDVSRTSLTVAEMLRRCNPRGINCECAEGATRDA